MFQVQMNSRSNLHILYAILVLMVAQVHSSQLLCFVCEDCAEINPNTSKAVCDESYFEQQSTTLPPTITTDESTQTTTTTTASTPEVTETPEPTTTTTTKTTTTTSAVPTPPTPPTVGPVETTTALPTPPNVGTAAGPIDDSFVNSNEATTTPATPVTTLPTTIPQTTFLQPVKLLMEPSELKVRQLRSVINTNYTFHCYSFDQTINGTVMTSRGCSRLGTNEELCTQLEHEHNNTNVTNCRPCTNSLCNGSGITGASMVAVILGLVAALVLGYSA